MCVSMNHDSKSTQEQFYISLGRHINRADTFKNLLDISCIQWPLEKRNTNILLKRANFFGIE